jgi:hypothetical protein
MRKAVLPLAAVLLLRLSGVALAQGDPAAPAVKIDLPEPTVVTKPFDPKRPPAEMPTLTPPEAAQTVTAFSCQAEVSVSVDEEQVRDGGARVRVTVKGVEFHGRLDVTIWLPTDATKKIVRHEDAHRRISEMYYAKAEPVVRTAALRIIGRQYRGTGKNSQAAVKDAITKAIGEVNDAFMNATNFASEPVQKAFDRITRHGTNNVPEDEAIQRAIKEAAGTKPRR